MTPQSKFSFRYRKSSIQLSITLLAFIRPGMTLCPARTNSKCG
ncbi:Uncharacterised protein [Bordetella pertussis]|nr:Uncharacterised protein [Bordetella pertussis]CPL65308.1 Uncharacterised protein [Bordetella pertussis]CPM64193.1 Uncharacterised protein [Bordetella pertussis]CPN44868.1 Uncharacterised protein [Bordetella pertussis]CPO28505.1 Uncharacterised protein [Bordetella pertussis]